MENRDLNQKMQIESPSGFMMPFVVEDGGTIEQMLGYGEQVHPKTGKKFFHHGLDYICDHLPLYACASGTVIALGEDETHQNFITTRYGKFMVKYGHISEAFAAYGSKVEAGQQIATSGDFLHISVSLDGEDIDPIEFLNILFANIAQLASMGIKTHPDFIEFPVKSATPFDDDGKEVTDMLIRYLPQYIADMQSGAYRPLQSTLDSMVNTFMRAAERNYFFENAPMIGNPLGLSERAAPLVGKIQTLLVGDFLAYMASQHNIYLPSWNQEQKKNLLMPYLPPEG